jgi:hypothetical protein
MALKAGDTVTGQNKKRAFVLSLVGLKMYLLVGDNIIRIGLDTKRLFPHLANKAVPSLQVIFEKTNPLRIFEVRVDPCHFDSEGKYKVDEWERIRAMSVLSEVLSLEPADDKVINLKPKPYIASLTEKQKELIKSQIDKDFGVNTWESLPPNLKVGLWKTGRGRLDSPW